MEGRNTVQAIFIPGKKGQLFALHSSPVNESAKGECFVLAPPFAEEMNRCRYMCTMFSQRLTAQGQGFLSVDPYGTGDSAGDFVNADWGGWIDDLLIACEYAKAIGYKKISLFGIRLGAQLALEAAVRAEFIHRIVLWQPVISGKTTLTQFLRIRIAASLDREEDGGSVAEFEKQIEEGFPVQVAGYDISPPMYNGVKAAHLEQYLDFKNTPIAWFNTLASEDRKTPRFETDFLKKWSDHGATIHYESVIGPSYWAVHERTLAPTLVDATVAYVSGGA